MDKPIPEAVRDALSWLRAALDCPTFSWDADQRDAAEAALTAAQQPDHLVDANKMVAQQQGQAVAAQAEQSDRRTFPMGYDSHLRGLVTDNVASALLCCGIDHLPAGVLDTIASEIVRGYHNAQPPAEAQGQGGGEVRIPSAAEWCDENAAEATMEWRAGWDACRVEYPRIAPPSAPVGVPADILRIVDTAIDVCNDRDRPAMAEDLEAVRLYVEQASAALAQQPAAVDSEPDCPHSALDGCDCYATQHQEPTT